jgi:hypothetical protein
MHKGGNTEKRELADSDCSDREYGPSKVSSEVSSGYAKCTLQCHELLLSLVFPFQLRKAEHAVVNFNIKLDVLVFET